eukprot:3568597-Pyramimonas_sp.AAC.1
MSTGEGARAVSGPRALSPSIDPIHLAKEAPPFGDALNPLRARMIPRRSLEVSAARRLTQPKNGLGGGEG